MPTLPARAETWELLAGAEGVEGKAREVRRTPATTLGYTDQDAADML
jgi:hypothetical protein